MLTIRLIGRPGLERDGVPIDGPRGNKTWALLSLLVRSCEPLSRQRLVDDLFQDADDPMGALRWSLAELRRRTGLTDAFRGNPISADLGATVTVDVAQVAAGAVPDNVPEGEFLEGVEIKGSAGFETWLMIERQRVDAELLSLLRQATLRALAGRQYEQAVSLAGAMVRRSPLEEGPHILLISALSASGDDKAALLQVSKSEEMFRRELGVEPSEAIRAAARPSVSAPIPGVSFRASSEALRDAGLAALSAGAADAGIECLRGAAAAAETAGDTALIGECLLELGTALVHAIRGYDDEGSLVLEQAVEAATAVGSQLTAAKALSELAYIDILAGRRHSAAGYLAASRELADEPTLLAALTGFEAMNLSDWGKTGEAVEMFVRAVELSRSAGAVRRECWNLGIGARTLFIEGRLAEAAQWAQQSWAIAQQERWTAFRPWPEVWMAHIDMAGGRDLDEVRSGAEATFTLARQLQDPCWEGAAAELIGMTYVADGEHETGLEWLHSASTMCRRVTDSYVWIEAEILIAEAEAALRCGDLDWAESAARRALTETARGSMDGLFARTQALLAGM